MFLSECRAIPTVSTGLQSHQQSEEKVNKGGDLKEDKTPDERRSAMTWAQRLKRVFNIDVEICSRCGGTVKVIANTSDRCIEDQQVIDKILFHLKKKDGLPSPDVLPETRAPPHQQ